MGHSYWVEILRKSTGRAELRLPRDLGFYGDGRSLTLSLGDAATTKNMQDDAAAFEAWALAFLASGAVDQVHLKLESSEASPRHFERLIYRLHHFQALLPNQVSIEAPDLSGSRVLTAERLLLNQPVGHRLDADDARQARFAKVAAGWPSCSESDLELALEVSSALKATFGLEKLMRQWPVGLFSGSVSSDNYVFTGGKSAIDLLGVSADTLFLFELKNAKNRKAGIISELLFYSSVLRDAMRSRLTFGPTSKAKGCSITAQDILGCARIEAVLLAPSFHPIVSSEMLTYLNAALAAQWRDYPVRFSRAFITGLADNDILVSREAA